MAFEHNVQSSRKLSSKIGDRDAKSHRSNNIGKQYKLPKKESVDWRTDNTIDGQPIQLTKE